MKEIFLESHHINNLNFGFGQFNYHLLKGLETVRPPDMSFYVHGEDLQWFKNNFKDPGFKFKKYFSFRRYEHLRIRRKYDLWHSLNQNTSIEPYFDQPYLLTVHNISHVKDPENYKTHKNHVKFQEKLSRSSAITYISEYAKESTHQYFNVPNVKEYVIHNGQPLKYIEIPENFSPGFEIKSPFLFSIGEITERKNFMALIKMMPFLPDFNLIIAGKKSTEAAQEIKKAITNLKLEGRVFLPGIVSEAEKQYLYSKCSALVFPSLREGFGLPIIEAMRFGKPVFASHNTSLPEIGGEICNYWHNFDPEYMAAEVLKGLSNFNSDKEKLEKQLVSRAEQFCWNKAAAQYVQVYESLLK